LLLDFSDTDGLSFPLPAGMLAPVTKILTMEAVSDVARARAASYAGPVLLLKHSAWCGISSTALYAFRRHAERETDVPHWMVTIQTHPPVSEFITRTLHVAHQSPQLILLHAGAALWTRSHREISLATLQEALAAWHAEGPAEQSPGDTGAKRAGHGTVPQP
jgi:bacillithiol system protein YtxJ